MRAGTTLALPFIMGQEAAGVVTEAGANVTQVKPGDRVAYRGIAGKLCRICRRAW